MSQDSVFVWKKKKKKHWKWVGSMLGGLPSQVITRARWLVLAKLIETQMWCPPASVSQKVGGINKEITPSASISVWEKAAPLPLAPKPDDAVPPYMYLAPFILLLKSWSSEQVNPLGSKFRHSIFKSSVFNSSHFHLTQWQSPLVSTARSCMDFFSWHWSTRLGSLVWVEIYHISGGTSTAEYPSWFSTASCRCGTSLFWVSDPFISLEVVSSVYS